MPAGQSTFYNADYVEAVDTHSREGFSLAFFDCAADERRSALNDWADNHPEFLDAPQLDNDVGY